LVVKGDKDGNIKKMKNSYNLGKINGYKAISIVAGEFAIATDESEVAIATLLGSCVAMMFYDKVLKIKGMNHFILPASGGFADSFKYGLNSVETMLNSMYKLGCKKENLEVKIAGGASVITSSNNIGSKNVAFAKNFCETEKIKISSEHIYGEHGRVVLLANEFKTFIRYVTNTAIKEKIKNEEIKILEIANSKDIKSNDDNITLF